MPELPEVETVRAGLAAHVLGRRIAAVDVLSARAVRRTAGGADALTEGLVGRTASAAVRRGKFAWLLLDGEPASGGQRTSSTQPAPDGEPASGGQPTPAFDVASALLVHLGMSGQLLVRDAAAAHATAGVAHPHLRVRLTFADDGALDFVDQRTFGYVALEPLVPTADGGPGGLGAPDPALPAPVAHIARDLLDPALDLRVLARSLRRRRSGIKRVLLDQTAVSGVGNIYADEALWRAHVHPERLVASMPAARVVEVLGAGREVMSQALAQGGTSFDALYVNVNGASGYFDRSLAVYGQQGRPCPRCGTPIVRLSFMNRSSHLCPRCQRAPRAA